MKLGDMLELIKRSGHELYEEYEACERHKDYPNNPRRS